MLGLGIGGSAAKGRGGGSKGGIPMNLDNSDTWNIG